MKYSKSIIFFLMVTLVAGCSKSSSNSDASAAAQLDQVKQDASKTAQDMKDYTYAQKEEFVKTMQIELDNLKQEYADLAAKVDHASAQAKADAKPKMDALQAQIDALGVDLDKAKNSTESTWADVKAGAQKALDDTKQGFKDAGAWIDKQFNS